MNTVHHFQSTHYQPIFWSNIVNDACDTLMRRHHEIQKWRSILTHPLNWVSNISIKNKTLFLSLLNQIIIKTNQAAEIIFKYTCDHLSKRAYEHEKLIQLPYVQNQMVEITVLFENLKVSLQKKDVASQFYSIDLITQILHLLSVLGGARAVFKNHSIEIMFSLTVFKKFAEVVLCLHG